MRILRPKDTQAKVGLCDRELRDLEKLGLFPKRFTINPRGSGRGMGRAVGHLESDVDAWIVARAAAARQEAA